MNVIAEKIIETRRLKGLSQEELAEKSQLNLRTIQRIENNESAPRGKTLSLICETLQINLEELNRLKDNGRKTPVSVRLVNGLFLIALNMVLMGIIGFLTFDSEANLNSRFGAFLLSFFIPFFIVFLTLSMNGLERMFKFGIGFIIYFGAVMILHGFPVGFVSGLFPCFLIALTILYFGHQLKTI